jgi:hypothetical protein
MMGPGHSLLEPVEDEEKQLFVREGRPRGPGIRRSGPCEQREVSETRATEKNSNSFNHRC